MGDALSRRVATVRQRKRKLQARRQSPPGFALPSVAPSVAVAAAFSSTAPARHAKPGAPASASPPAVHPYGQVPLVPPAWTDLRQDTSRPI